MPDALSGSVEYVTYYNAENGFSVLRLKPDEDALSQESDGTVAVTGILPELSVGEHLEMQGEWVKDPRFGIQFKVQKLQQTLPTTVEGIRRYLSSGLLKGVGPTIAGRIVDHFGAQTIEIIDKQPERLREVADIGPKRQKHILTAWDEQRQVRDVMVFLSSHGVSVNLATRIHKEYGNRAMEVVKKDPYRLARDLQGVGFLTADRIAKSFGLPADHPARMEAGLLYTLAEFTGEGHVYAPRPQLQARATELLGTAPQPVSEAIDRLAARQDVVLEDETVYPPTMHAAELGVVELLGALANAPNSATADMPLARDPEALSDYTQLDALQRQAVLTALRQPVSILTGGPGTGKTTTMKTLIGALELAGKRYALAAPTGRAAKRLSQTSSQPASTIHRLIGYTPGEGPKYNEDEPLNIDLIVIDEASMLDLQLTHTLLKAIKPGTHLLLVGDVDQLPSVGAGDVLRDLIASAQYPVTRLETIYRQGENSNIVSNAHAMNRGELPQTSKDAAGDFFIDATDNAKEANEKIVALVSQRIPSRFKLDPLQDIQVLSPMYRGEAGVAALNEALQKALNPPSALKPERRLHGQLLRVGDRLMQIRNNYDKTVFNGDIGRLVEIVNEEQTLTVDFEGRRVSYEWSEAEELTLAYAITVHKAQGSEFHCVVMPVLTQHYIMLQRNLLYTGVTRAQSLCVLVGSRKAIGMAVNNNKVAQRWTGLARRLTGAGLQSSPQ
ncbi:MAG: ATP-dependent RecD-like DNA helicase [Anaerolineales bacterium]|nr:ATP-dependent RecD-like DNA helicase [Anaerolineales bacterium]